MGLHFGEYVVEITSQFGFGHRHCIAEWHALLWRIVGAILEILVDSVDEDRSEEIGGAALHRLQYLLTVSAAVRHSNRSDQTALPYLLKINLRNRHVMAIAES